MSSSKSASRSGSAKKDSSSRYGTRLMTLEKGKRINSSKETNSRKSCECLLKPDNWKSSKVSQNSRVPAKKTSSKASVKDGKKSDHHEKVVIVSKRSSSVSVVKSCSLRKSVSVRKVSYSTSVVLSSEEEEETETEEDSEEESHSRSRKKKTVLKRTTSKVKSTYQKSRKSDRAAKKAKAIKLLCEKLSSSNKSKSNERELRPRFPYSMLQEWPTARAHRMASLNALAKVHVLYENESRTAGENLKDADETSLIDFLNEENSDDTDSNDDDNDEDDDDSVHMAYKPSNSSYDKKRDRSKSNDNEKSRSEKKPKPQLPMKRAKKRKASDVEIIDTRVCKRMASLNAQAILAASYIPEPKPKRVNRKFDKRDICTDMDLKVVLESKCDLEIIETEKQTISPKKESSSTCDKNIPLKCSSPDMNESKSSDATIISDSMSPSGPPYHNSWRIEPDLNLQDSHSNEIPASDSIVTSSTTASTKVGVTQYTEVTKVQINSRNDLEVKEESKSERKFERILGNDDVAITQMYHYQSKNSNESYCVQMQTTYKPGSRNLSPAALPLSPTAPIHPHIGDPVLHGRPNYYGCSSHSPMLPAPPYHMSPSVGGIHPVMGMDHRIPHQYGGSAFSVPHYRHPQPMQFPHGDYGYYQPAGPLIQPHHDQYTIHKPVPYHPQPHLHPSPSRPQPPSSHRDPYSSLDPGRIPSKTSALSSHAPAVKPNSALPLHSSLGEAASHSSFKPSSQERCVANTKPAPYSTSPKPISPAPLHPPYPVQSGYREYHKPKPHSSSASYSKHCDPHALPPAQNYSTESPHNVSYQKNRHTHLDPREPGGHCDSQAISHPPLIEVPHHSSYSAPRDNHKVGSDPYVKERGWSIKTSPDDSPNTPVSFLPYQIDPVKETPSVNMPEPLQQPLRPPSVIEIVEETSRDTKTYIQLEVPKNSYREKIVVVDVENDEINKEPECLSSNNKPQFDISQEKTDIPAVETFLPSTVSEKSENDTGNVCDDTSSKIPVEKSADSVKDSPDVMVLEVKKKKESAVVRRARLHGKQRTFRDAYNRPLVPLSKVKKSEGSVSEENVKNESKTVAAEVSLPPPLPPPKLPEKKFAHGWSWEGQTFEKQVYVSNDESPCIRHCYPAIKHVEGDVIHVRDCVLLKSGPRKTDLPFVAKITALWANPADGEMIMSLMWYYRPEHTETEKKLHHMEDEIFASKHKDTNSVACIEDKCYVLTYSEYCRYRKRCKLIEDSATCPTSIVPEIEEYPRMKRLPPPNVSPDLVFFCRKVYDFRQKRLLKNPV